jgi:hypothetical protein
MFVQLDGDRVLTAFPCAQDGKEWPGMVEIEDDDPRYLEFIAPREPELITNPVEKLKAFLIENPDVAAILQ